MRIRSNLVVLAILAVVVVSMLASTGGRQRTAPLALTAAEPAEPSVITAVAPVAMPVAPPSVSPVAAAAPVETVDTPPAALRSGKAGTYTAVWGDTVSNLAAEMGGGNDKANRDAVIHANPSLRRDPDRLFAGQTYTIPADGTRAPAQAPVQAASQSSEPSAPAALPLPAAAVQPPVAADPDNRQLRYTARTGDTVSMLAAVLLGENGKANRDMIVGANPSLQRNPDRVVDGRVYRIPVREENPLSAAPKDQTPSVARPAVQPDADLIIEAGSPRRLRYTARPGDTVSTLALALLGSDTLANRAVVIGLNPSLIQDPSHVVAGQVYWITAPATSATPAAAQE